MRVDVRICLRFIGRFTFLLKRGCVFYEYYIGSLDIIVRFTLEVVMRIV